MIIEAAKFHSYGNDFLIVADPVPLDRRRALARSICDPHFGVGADGCVFLRPLRGDSEFEFRIHNRDGGQAGMSGNGARCAAAFLVRRKPTVGATLALDTLSGRKVFQLLDHEPLRWKFRSLMGQPSFDPAAVPFLAAGLGPGPEEWDVEAAGRVLRVRPLSVGNPQCVVLDSKPPSDEEFHRLGPALESHPRFPERTNVSFVRALDRNRLEIRIWERGVGPTHSSGTGSCGAAVAAIRAGWVSSPVEVRTATGSQTVQWREGEEIALTGWAELIADVAFHWAGGQ